MVTVPQNSGIAQDVPFTKENFDPDGWKSLPYNKKAILLSYQIWSTYMFRLFSFSIQEKGRRVGGTWGYASEWVLQAAKTKLQGGQDGMYMGTEKEMAREFIDACADFARVYQMAAGEIHQDVIKDGNEKEIYVFRIEFDSGNKILATTSEPRALRGHQGHILIDEAAFHDDLEAVIKAAGAFLIRGSHVALVSTHNGEDNYFNDLIKEVRTGQRRGCVLTVSFLDAVQAGLYMSIARSMRVPYTKEWESDRIDDVYSIYQHNADEELHVIPAQGSGAVLPLSLLEARQESDIPVVRWTAPDDMVSVTDQMRELATDGFLRESIEPLLKTRFDRSCPTVFGFDFARVVDLSVLWVAQIKQDTTLWPAYVLELRKVPYTVQWHILRYCIDNVPNFAGGKLDKGGGGGYIAEQALMRYGSRLIEEVQFSERVYLDHSPKLISRFTDGTTRIPRDRDITDDHRVVKKVKGVIKVPASRTESAAGGKRHGDAYVAHLLASMAADYPVADWKHAESVGSSFDDPDDTESSFGRWS